MSQLYSVKALKPISSEPRSAHDAMHNATAALTVKMMQQFLAQPDLSTLPLPAVNVSLPYKIYVIQRTRVLRLQRGFCISDLLATASTNTARPARVFIFPLGGEA